MKPYIEIVFLCIFAFLNCGFASLGEDFSSNFQNKRDENEDFVQTRNGKYLPVFVRNVLYPNLPFFQNELKETKPISYSSNDDNIEGRLFKLFTTSNVGVDPSHILISTLNANIPRMTSALESIAKSFDTISMQWQFGFSEMILMQFVNGINEIAKALANPPPPNMPMNMQMAGGGAAGGGGGGM
ncbi:UNVERIFIED_CONTAM: hypothetical protein RMT77_017435 [Armadillidium vulgare]|nr:hypothetical protein Avbf_11143 [Armadillidium vulgare]